MSSLMTAMIDNVQFKVREIAPISTYHTLGAFLDKNINRNSNLSANGHQVYVMLGYAHRTVDQHAFGTMKSRERLKWQNPYLGCA